MGRILKRGIQRRNNLPGFIQDVDTESGLGDRFRRWAGHFFGKIHLRFIA